MSGAPVPVSTPGMDLWRPSGDRLTYGDAAWAGAAWGIALYGILHFFSVFMAFLEPALVVFVPAERIAAGLAGSAPPFVRWIALLGSQGCFWALGAVAALGLWHEAARALGARRQAHRVTR